MTYDELITDMIDLKEGSYIDTVWQRIEYATDVVVTGRREDGTKAFTRECTLSDFEMDVTVLAGVNRGLAEIYRNQLLFNARYGVMAEVLKKPSLKELDFSWRLYGERREQHATREQMDRFIEAWYGRDDDSE